MKKGRRNGGIPPGRKERLRVFLIKILIRFAHRTPSPTPSKAILPPPPISACPLPRHNHNSTLPPAQFLLHDPAVAAASCAFLVQQGKKMQAEEKGSHSQTKTKKSTTSCCFRRYRQIRPLLSAKVRQARAR